ncbi:hypothetical protein GHT06_017596 [Daphnia sinensis]|uniref:Uncharacterized protein n=1 Tax=Daphnia sinensis TaxID=1820382 RepID=A0AAD5KLB9_9CRUS|nr:hypothetical protein GHT06_017596 [Daphnia sinensis]
MNPPPLSDQTKHSEEGKRVLNFARIVNDGATSTQHHMCVRFPLLTRPPGQ